MIALSNQSKIKNPLLLLPSDTIVFEDSNNSYSIKDLITKMGQVIDFCQKNNLSPGTRLAIDMPVSFDWLGLFFGFIDYGIIVVPINYRLPIDERKAYADQVGCRLYVDKFDWEKYNIVDINEHWDLQNSATIIFTSGSSNKPKGALHSLGNHYFSAIGSNQNIKLNDSDGWWLCLPVYHVGGIAILFRCLLSGAKIIINENSLNITHCSLVPTQLINLIKTNKLQNLKVVLLGGASVSNCIIDLAIKNKVNIYTTYGSTEMSSQICTVSNFLDIDELKTVGRPLRHCNVKISKHDEILVCGKTLFMGYLNGDTIDLQLDNEGWFATGDCGKFDSMGRLIVVGRKDDLIISGGENIQPTEIENNITKITGLLSYVVGIDDEVFGQRPVAFINGDFNIKNLAHELSLVLPKYKIPDYFFKLDSDDKSLKVNKKLLLKKANDLIV